MANKTSVKQEKFIDLILEGKTQRVAYNEAGYVSKTPGAADVRACKMLKGGRVAKALDQRRADLAAEANWTHTKLIKSFQSLYEKCCQAEAIFDSAGKHTGQYKFDSAGACRALENIAKMIGAYQQPDGNILIINQFYAQFRGQVERKYGETETE